MRRSICSCEPAVARAGQTSTWQFHYTTANPLPKGTSCKFNLMSQGRDIDWEIPSVDLDQSNNVIFVRLEEGTVVPVKEVFAPDALVPHYEFTLPTALKVGATFTIVIGAGPDHSDPSVLEEYGNECQLTIQRRRPFYLYIDPKGKGNYADPEIFSMDIRGNSLRLIRILTPSFVTKNKRFDITVRFEDEFGNLTNYAPEETLIELSYENLRDNLNWKLFVPETGFVILPNLYFNEVGVYRIQLKNLLTQETFFSAPVKCFQENAQHLFWGLLHGESDRVDSTENIESCLRHFRDDHMLNFFATSCFENANETSPEMWKTISHTVASFNEEDRFVTILGFQYQGEPEKEGVRHILYYKDNNKPLLRQKEAKYASLPKLYKSVTAKEILSIPTFTMGKGSSFDFENFNPEFERVAEIYNAWGSSEQVKGAFPITGEVEATAEGSLVAALRRNCRLGFVAGGLDDRGIYASFYEGNQVQYSPGLTAIICDKYTREALLDALARRSCYATTGPRILVGFSVAGQPMGSELSTASKPGLTVNRHLAGYVAGTAPLEKVEILRNGEVFHTFSPQGHVYDYCYDDMEPLEKIVLKEKGEGPPRDPFVFYYLRVTQQDGHKAWSSPIWVDLSSERPTKEKKNG